MHQVLQHISPKPSPTGLAFNRPQSCFVTRSFVGPSSGCHSTDLDDRNSGATLHAFFLASAPESPDLERLYRLLAPDERFHLSHEVTYPHAPSGFGRSRLAGSIEHVLGVSATARNWRTVTALDALATSDE